MRQQTRWTSFTYEVSELMEPAYDLVEYIRLWQLGIEECCSEYGFQTVAGLPKLFLVGIAQGKIALLHAKIVDDVLLAGMQPKRKRFWTAISHQFKLSRIIMVKEVIFSRPCIKQTREHSIEISMVQFMRTTDHITFSRDGRKEWEKHCSASETKSVQSWEGRIKHLRHRILPQAAKVTIAFQQIVPNMRVTRMAQANQRLRQVLKLNAKSKFIAPFQQLWTKDLEHFSLIVFSDASTGRSSYGQTEYIAGMTFHKKNEPVFHSTNCLSSKAGRISFSAFGAEINSGICRSFYTNWGMPLLDGNSTR